MKSEDLSTCIPTWAQDHYPGFVSCVNKLANLNNSDKNELISLLHQLRDQSHILPEHLARQLFEPFSDPHGWATTSTETTADKSVLSAVIHLLVALAVHFNGMSQDVVDVFVTLLFSTSNPPFTSINLAIQFFHSLIEAAPQSERLVTERILDKFPGWRKPLNDFSGAVLNTLYLFCAPTSSVHFSASSKCLLITELCQLVIDLEFNLDETEMPPPIENTCDPKPAESVVNDETFESVHSRMMQKLSNASHEGRGNNWTKLDRVTWFILSFVRFLCSKTNDTQPNKLDWQLLCDVFKKMRELFAQHILPVSTAITAFPLICFYTTSLRGGLMVSLTEFLWTAVKDEHKDVDSRLNALSYLTFLISRVSACFLDLVVELLHEMTGWCVDYVYRNRGRIAVTNTTSLYQENSVYYAICDAVFYCLVQLHSLLFESSYYRGSCDRLPLAQIRLSPLDPWSHMPVSLRRTVSQLVSSYNLGGWGLFGLDMDMCDTKENSFSVQDLANLEASSLFSLPMRTIRLSLCAPAQFQLLRPFTLGRSILIATIDRPEHSSVKSPSRKRRKLPSQKASGLSCHPGVDVTKLARIVNDS